MKRTQRVGLLGGTFDPIHVGHLDAADAAYQALALDRVILIPSLQPPHRAEPPQASPFHRFAMTCLAAATKPYYQASDLELRSAGGPSYTIDTLRRVQASGLNAIELFFVTGADAFAEIATWKGYPHVLEHAHFVVVSRPGFPAASIGERVPAWSTRMRDATAGFTAKPLPCVLIVDGATADVSSTAIRTACRERRSITGLVPAPVEAHILRHGLYREHSETLLPTELHGQD